MCDFGCCLSCFLFNDYTLFSTYFTVAERSCFQGNISFS